MPRGGERARGSARGRGLLFTVFFALAIFAAVVWKIDRTDIGSLIPVTVEQAYLDNGVEPQDSPARTTGKSSNVLTNTTFTLDNFARIFDGEEFWGGAVYEIEPTRPEGGRVVWSWHAMDHLVQDRQVEPPARLRNSEVDQAQLERLLEDLVGKAVLLVAAVVFALSTLYFWLLVKLEGAELAWWTVCILGFPIVLI